MYNSAMKKECPVTTEKPASEMQTRISELGSYAEEIHSNASVTGNLNSQFKYNQTMNGPYEEMSKGASTNVYLTKISADKSKKKDTSEFHPGKALGATVAGGIAGIPFALGGRKVGRDLLHNISTSKGESDLGTLKKMMRDNKLNTTFNHRTHAEESILPKKGASGYDFARLNIDAAKHGGLGPVYLHSTMFGGKKNFIGGVKSHGKSTVNKDTIMHELGHAKDLKNFGKAKLVSGVVGNKLGPLATMAALSHDKTRDYAVPIAAVSVLPTLRNEAAANYHAYKGIEAHKGVGSANKFLKRVVSKNMGNYGLMAAGTVASTYAAKKIMDKWSPRKGTK